MSQSETIPFHIEYDGRSYDCERVVRGVRVLSQVVRVLGVGHKPDSRNYKQGARDQTASMAVAAKIIAREIIVEPHSRAS